MGGLLRLKSGFLDYWAEGFSQERLESVEFSKIMGWNFWDLSIYVREIEILDLCALDFVKISPFDCSRGCISELKSVFL